MRQNIFNLRSKSSQNHLNGNLMHNSHSQHPSQSFKVGKILDPGWVDVFSMVYLII